MPRATVETSRARDPKGEVRHFREGIIFLVAPMVCADGVLRIRLQRETVDGGVHYDRGKTNPLWVVRSHYLDGLFEDIGYLGEWGKIAWHEKEILVPGEVVKGRTKSIADFGRLQQACASLSHVVDQLPQEPSDAQMESVMLSYQGVLAWMNDARKKLVEAEGQVDALQAKIMSRLS